MFLNISQNIYEAIVKSPTWQHEEKTKNVETQNEYAQRKSLAKFEMMTFFLCFYVIGYVFKHMRETKPL